MNVLATHDQAVACDPFLDPNCTTEPTFPEPEPSGWEQFFGFLSNWWMLLVILAVVGFLIYHSYVIVQEKEATIIERLGRFHKIMHAGLGFTIPVIDRIRATMELDIKQFEETVKVKTLDNTWVQLPVSVHYCVDENRVREAFYKLEDPKTIIQNLVLHSIKSAAAKMTLEGVFTSHGELDHDVRVDYIDKVSSYGYEIIDVVINEPQVSQELEDASNNVMAAQRRQDAAKADAEALRIKSVGEATAQAEGMKISTEAFVVSRDALAEGNAKAIQKMVGDTGLSPRAALDFLAISDGNDAIRDAAGKGATIVVATPSPQQDGLYAALHALNGNHANGITANTSSPS